jgi:hypothetical protein
MSENCPGCNLPRVFRYIIKWDDNGTIVTRMNPFFRVVLLESDLLDDIYVRIEETVGVPIRHIVIEAERAGGKATFDAMLPKRFTWLMRNRLVLWVGARLIPILGRMAGLADAKVIFNHPFRGSMARIRNAFSPDIYAAMSLGAFESMEGVRYESTWVELDGETYMLNLPTKQESDIKERMSPEIIAPLAGDHELEVCPRCGLPKALRHLRWDLADARIIDTRRGVRMSFVDGYACSAVFRELVAELGEDIVPIIIEASHQYEARHLEETGLLAEARDRESMYDDFLRSLPVKGQGNPVLRELADETLSVTIENPYSPYLLAGQLLAAYEAIDKTAGVAEVDEFAPQRMKISVSSA